MEVSLSSAPSSALSRSKKRRQRRKLVTETGKHASEVQKVATPEVRPNAEGAVGKRKTKHKRTKSALKANGNEAKKPKVQLQKNVTPKTTPAKQQNAEKRSATGSKFESRKRPKFSYDDVESRLKAARFRHLNELYYTQSSAQMVNYLGEHRSDFFAYHDGYQHQAALWPLRPVDVIINWLRRLPERFVIADFGCGEAHIARAFPGRKVHSFDLVSVYRKQSCGKASGVCDQQLASLVTECDMRNVPLADSSVDVAIFCLSLMNTNLVEFICEAHRVLRTGGLLKVVEIRSRFEKVGNFVHKVRKFGFENVSRDEHALLVAAPRADDETSELRPESDMFVAFEFRKIEDLRQLHSQVARARKSGSDVLTAVNWPAELILRPCVYKKR